MHDEQQFFELTRLGGAFPSACYAGGQSLDISHTASYSPLDDAKTLYRNGSSIGPGKSLRRNGP